ncbi:MAG: hypothetical protein JXM79_14135 [Sedimentisphaerales bacterium]|nr:hypothetical protein [Sedimentisphaerales bacterium]
MKTNEGLLGIIAMTVILMTFGIVIITADYMKKSVNVSVSPASLDGKNGPMNKPLLYSAAGNNEKTDQKIEFKNTPSVDVNKLFKKRPVTSQAVARFGNDQTVSPEVKERLKPVISNGRVYLENTSGVEACATNEKENIEVIE